MRALALSVVVLVAGSLAAAVEPARACSCIPPDPWSFLKQADGAFVGRLVSRRETDQGRVVLTFTVERVAKGHIGKAVEVNTASNGGACGIEASVGQRVGLFVMREDDSWVGHLCWQVEPSDLFAAALPLPPPNGRGHVALVVGGKFGIARLIALDSQGRTLAYGRGGGWVETVSVCPGNARLAELVSTGSRLTLVIRTTQRLRVVRQQAVSLLGWRFAKTLTCENASGTSVLVLAGGDPLATGALYRFREGRRTTLWKGEAFDIAITGSTAYLSVGRKLLRVDLATGHVTRLATLSGPTSLVLNESEMLLVGLDGSLDRPLQVVRVDLTRQPAKIATARVARRGVWGQVFWLPAGRLLFVPTYRGDTARVLNRLLRMRSRFKWTPDSAAVIDSSVFGIDQTGALFRAELPFGPQRFLRRLPGRTTVIVSATG